MCWSVKWKFLQIVKFSRHAKPYIFLPDLLILMLIKPCRGCRPKHAWMQGMDTQPVACDDAVVYMYQEAAQMICPVNQIQSEERKRLYFGFYCVVYVYAHDFAKMKKKNTNQVIIEFHLFMTVKCQLLTAYSNPIKPEGRKWPPLNIQRNLMIPYCLYLSYDIQQL